MENELQMTRDDSSDRQELGPPTRCPVTVAISKEKTPNMAALWQQIQG